MRILAIESSGLVAGVAVVEGDLVNEETVAEYTVNFKKTHSQTLLPMLDETAKMIELDLDTIDAVAVSGGPGSFSQNPQPTVRPLPCPHFCKSADPAPV